MAPSLFDQPGVRLTDPETSALAAQRLRASSGLLIQTIRHALTDHGPLTHDEIVDAVNLTWPDRWLPATIVTACARAGLYEVGREHNARGNPVAVWDLIPGDVQTIRVAGGQL